MKHHLHLFIQIPPNKVKNHLRHHHLKFPNHHLHLHLHQYLCHLLHQLKHGLNLCYSKTISQSNHQKLICLVRCCYKECRSKHYFYSGVCVCTCVYVSRRKKLLMLGFTPYFFHRATSSIYKRLGSCSSYSGSNHDASKGW